MISKKSDDAISPVIGVMLMLVVTVVIAAAVTIFATGVVGETEAAPVAVLDVDIIADCEALPGLSGPDFQVTHISGDPVDTADIEFRFSWTHDGCSHYSTFSAEGFEDADIDYGNYADAINHANKPIPLFVKSTMPGGEGGYKVEHVFGKVTLTPGLKLITRTEALNRGEVHTNSPFMDVIFDNYHVSTAKSEQRPYIKVGMGYLHSPNLMGSNDDTKGTYDPNCPKCYEYNGNQVKTDGTGMACSWSKGKFKDRYGLCQKCYKEGHNHKIDICSSDNPDCIASKCFIEDINTKPIVTITPGIMEHLKPGTAVDVMIVHIPSGKAIYDNTVIVQ